MIFTDSKILSDKVNLIYRNNRNSPLFVRAAYYQLESNNVDTAIEILNKGIKTYPDHPVAYLLLGKAYTIFGNYNLAEEFIRKGSNLLQSNETYEHYIAEVVKIREQRSTFNITRDKLFPEDTNSDQKQREESDKRPDDIKKITSSVDERFEQLARTVSNAKSNKPDESKLNSNSDVIVSETLANIYSAQGQIDEAVKIYEKLINKNPDKTDYYSEKIQTLRSSQNS